MESIGQRDPETAALEDNMFLAGVDKAKIDRRPVLQFDGIEVCKGSGEWTASMERAGMRMHPGVEKKEGGLFFFGPVDLGMGSIRSFSRLH